ncbi:MAG: N-acetylglucosamine-specific PTS transporter subunit IIBC [Eubacteriales bacterium]|nr:N-acetylglucosamine-specific PTS transporter subunit IIBC [Eubacteriales bacterium]
MKQKLQALGRALMQPVALLPAAALMLGIGYWIDPSGWGGNNPFANFLVKGGASILDFLGILFAVGVAYGLSKDKNGAAALSGLVGFLMVTNLLNAGSVAIFKGIPLEELDSTLGFEAINNKNVFIGILVGILAAAAYNRFYQAKLPDAFAFFSGRRLVPIITAVYAILASVVLFFAWPIIYKGLVGFGNFIMDLGPIGAGIYGFFNRLLIPTGLHHALNNVFWFDAFGIGDITNYWNPEFAQTATAAASGYYAGMYQAGFFPIMMFGLPGAALAMIHTAKPEKRKVAASLLLSGLVASFVTGVTEPIEFSFMFLSPLLYLIHALFTGISVALVAFLRYASGFTFSAGLIDYILGFKLKTVNKPLMLLVVGVAFFVLYYFVFRFMITKLNLQTPGRELEVNPDEGRVLDAKETNFTRMAETILAGLGGKENIENLDYCITRLRVEVKDNLLVNENKIKEAQVAGIVRPSKSNVQVIIGPQVQAVKDEMDKML